MSSCVFFESRNPGTESWNRRNVTRQYGWRWTHRLRHSLGYFSSVPAIVVPAIVVPAIVISYGSLAA